MGKCKKEQNIDKKKEEKIVKENLTKEVEDKEVLDSKVKELEDKIKELEDRLDKEKNDYLRLMAEFETFRRRTTEEKVNVIASAGSDTIKGLLPVLDDLERAMELLSTSEDQAAKEGTSLIYEKLFAYLTTKGLEVIEAKGEIFNTDFHEAVTQFPTQKEEEKGRVIDVIQTGYLLNSKVLRYAKVVVGV